MCYVLDEIDVHWNEQQADMSFKHTDKNHGKSFLRDTRVTSSSSRLTHKVWQMYTKMTHKWLLCVSLPSNFTNVIQLYGNTAISFSFINWSCFRRRNLFCGRKSTFTSVMPIVSDNHRQTCNYNTWLFCEFLRLYKLLTACNIYNPLYNIFSHTCQYNVPIKKLSNIF